MPEPVDNTEQTANDFNAECVQCGTPFDMGEAQYGEWWAPTPAAPSKCPNCRPDNPKEN